MAKRNKNQDAPQPRNFTLVAPDIEYVHSTTKNFAFNKTRLHLENQYKAKVKELKTYMRGLEYRKDAASKEVNLEQLNTTHSHFFEIERKMPEFKKNFRNMNRGVESILKAGTLTKVGENKFVYTIRRTKNVEKSFKAYNLNMNMLLGLQAYLEQYCEQVKIIQSRLIDGSKYKSQTKDFLKAAEKFLKMINQFTNLSFNYTKDKGVNKKGDPLKSGYLSMTTDNENLLKELKKFTKKGVYKEFAKTFGQTAELVLADNISNIDGFKAVATGTINTEQSKHSKYNATVDIVIATKDNEKNLKKIGSKYGENLFGFEKEPILLGANVKNLTDSIQGKYALSKSDLENYDFFSDKMNFMEFANLWSLSTSDKVDDEQRTLAYKASKHALYAAVIDSYIEHMGHSDIIIYNGEFLWYIDYIKTFFFGKEFGDTRKRYFSQEVLENMDYLISASTFQELEEIRHSRDLNGEGSLLYLSKYFYHYANPELRNRDFMASYVKTEMGSNMAAEIRKIRTVALMHSMWALGGSQAAATKKY